MRWWAIFISILICTLAEAADVADSVRYILPEHVVTGTRREFRWLESPSAISVLSIRDQPQNRGLGLSDNLLLVPGLAANTRFGTDDIRLAVRGLGARSNSGVRGVRVLYDGIPESEPDGQTRLEGIEIGNLDQVEVLRGAGSALYGNAAGGVLNLRSAAAFPRAGVRIEGVGGGFGYSKIKASAGTGKLPSDSSVTAALDFRDGKFSLDPGMGGEGGVISVSHVRADGWREHSKYEGQIISGSWTTRATPRSSLRTVFYFTNVTAQLPGPLAVEQYKADSRQADSTWTALDVGRITRKGRLGLLYAHKFGDRWLLHFTPYAALKKLDRARENGQYQTISRYILGGTLQTEWAGMIAERYETEIIAGLDQQLQDGPVSFYENLSGTRGDSLLSQEQERQWGQGYFAQWEVEKKRTWGVVLGGRYDRVFFYDEFLNEPTPAVTYKKGAFTPRVAVRGHLSPDWIAFGSLYGGFETPTLTESENTIGVDVKPQKTLTVELGVRGEQMIRGIETRWEATLYRMTVTDAIVPDKIAGEKLYTNAAEAVHQGVELSARLSRPRLGYVGLAVSLGDYVFTDYRTVYGDFTDKKLPGVSPNLVGAVARWTPRTWFFAELNARASGSAWANTENTVKADGYAILGAAVGGQLPLDFMTASWYVSAQNLTDQKYVSFIQVNDSKSHYFEGGMPQAIFAGITLGTKGL